MYRSHSNQIFERIFKSLQFIGSKINCPEHNPRRLDEAGEMLDEVMWLRFQQTSRFQISGRPSSKIVTTPFEEVSQAGFSLVHRQAAAGGVCGQCRMYVMREDLESANTDGTCKSWEEDQSSCKPQLNRFTNPCEKAFARRSQRVAHQSCHDRHRAIKHAVRVIRGGPKVSAVEHCIAKKGAIQVD